MREVLSQYAAIKDAELRSQRRRQKAAFALEPALEPLAREQAALLARKGLLLAAGDEASLAQLAEDERRLTEVTAQIAALLARHGLPGDELELRYRCEFCQDTGYVGGRRCSCLEHKLFALSGRQSNLAALEQENFSTFDLSVFPEENGQREGAGRLRDLCRAYADQFPENARRNILLFGSVGVGKSFLLNCVAAHVLHRGYSVRRLTAYQFIQLALDMVRSGDPSAMRELEKVDLLVLDDLGSEPQIRNITTEQLYAVVDERLLARKPILFATNLDPEQLKARYGERMISRLLDTRLTFCARMRGKDLRLNVSRRGE